MKMTLKNETVESVFDLLKAANSQFNSTHPGESTNRQPVHTVYGGAHLFRADSSQRMGNAALIHLKEYAPQFDIFAKALELKGHESLPAEKRDISRLAEQLRTDPKSVGEKDTSAYIAVTVYDRVVEKLKREPVEDFRIDFEDGYGHRPDEEEDADAIRTAEEVAKGMNENSLPPFIGIRIKPLTEELKLRSIRTLDLFISSLINITKVKLPENFVVTLPKVTVPEQVSALISLFEAIESNAGLTPHSLKMELMVETPQSILDSNGNSALPNLVRAAKGRCIAAHFGVYDYTASSNITAAYQGMTHPTCDFARHMMQVALAGSGIRLSDGATNIIPVGSHRPIDGQPLIKTQVDENRKVVYEAWKLNYNDIRHSLKHGFYQGWDLHPSQLSVRYAAVYSFFLEGLEAATQRLKSFMDKATQATLGGGVFDDAATGQALLNFFLRGISYGALTEEEATESGLTLEEIRLRSFKAILQGRQK